jgi:hypothetical protein
MKTQIVFNPLLRGWYVVRGAHDTPIGGRFDSRDQALQHLRHWQSEEKRAVKAYRNNPQFFA